MQSRLTREEWSSEAGDAGHGVFTVKKSTGSAIVREMRSDPGDRKTDPAHINEDLLDMIKILSHDIRSPLVTITAALKLLQKGAYGGMDGQVSEELENLYNMVIRTIGNLEDFLGRALSLNNDLDSPRERLLLKRDVLDPVIGEFLKDPEKSGADLELRISSGTFGDFPTQGNMFLLRSVFRNLIRNALNHGRGNCKIIIDLRDQGPDVGIDVFNSGRPVPEDLRDVLFNKFNKIKKGTSGVPEGMGLGLYLVKGIVNSHGGDIRYEAAPEGSHFIFTLPFKAKEGNVISDPEKDPNKGPGKGNTAPH